MRPLIKQLIPPQGISQRIKLQDLTCPLIRLDKARRKDKSMGFFISVILHALIFAVAGFSLIKQPQFGVDQGQSGVDVDLVAASAPVTPEPVITLPFEEIKSDFVEKVPELPLVPVKPQPSSVNTKGKDEVTAQSTGGAISEAKPDYLKNPAPDYPDVARRRGYEGTVLLTAVIDQRGNPLKVDVKQGSGHSVLDEAALKAVKKWRFRPGMLGNIPVESTVYVPVRFSLQDA